MPSPTELARDAQKHSESLRTDFEYLRNSIEKIELDKLRERVVVQGENLADLRIAKVEAEKLFLQVAVLEEKVTVLQKSKDESEKRQWQHVYLFAGSMLTLLCTIVVQLVLVVLKK